MKTVFLLLAAMVFAAWTVEACDFDFTFFGGGSLADSPSACMTAFQLAEGLDMPDVMLTLLICMRG